MSDEQSTRDEFRQAVKSAIGYEPVLVSPGGLQHRTASDRDWLMERISDALTSSSAIRRIQAEAWAEGADYAWGKTGEGWNGEYADGHGTHDGTVSFIDANGDHNPYRGEQP